MRTNLGPRVTVMTNQGDVLARVGDIRAGRGPHQFLSPHGLAVDSHGDLYVGEVSYTAWPRFPLFQRQSAARRSAQHA